LGITDVYASPLLKARRGSAHGYDVIDPACLNPELGDEETFARMVRKLKQYGMGLLLDIVPNHMAASDENPWWQDVLQNGLDSPYADYFDLDWDPGRPGLSGKVILPILGAPYGNALENQEITLILEDDGFWVDCYGRRLPLRPASYCRILTRWLEGLSGLLGTGHPAVLQLMDLLDELNRLPSPKEKQEFTNIFQQIKDSLRQWSSRFPEVKAFVEEDLRCLNGRAGNPQSFNFLDQLLREQVYRLAFWQVANEESNYRRFFDINDLVSIQVEEEHVFTATHDFILQLARSGQVTGLRIDHIDGLYDPETYLSRLQEHLHGKRGKPGFYVVAEKILGSDEEIPSEWPVCGSTGYDFLNKLSGIFVDKKEAGTLNELFTKLDRKSVV